jgi:hypothetical protein
LWNKTYGNPSGGENIFEGLGSGNPALIFDECWGIQEIENRGLIMSCGTGIEECDKFSEQLLKECSEDPKIT